MPELPEVETVRSGLEGALVGARFERVEQRRPNLRFPFPDRFAARLEGVRVSSLDRRAKYLLGRLESGDVLAMHLGMSGRFTVHQPSGTGQPGHFVYEPPGGAAHDHVVFHMNNGAVVVYNDVRRFGFMTLIGAHELDAHKLFRGLGVEPLSDDLSPAFIAHAFANKQTPLKAALLDQKLIAGLGNIYVCEALHRARLSPVRSAASLTKASGGPGVRATRLTAAIKSILSDAIAAGGSSLKDYQHADGSLGYFQHSFAVYGRDGQSCPRAACSGTIQRIVQSGRSTFFCACCQR